MHFKNLFQAEEMVGTNFQTQMNSQRLNNEDNVAFGKPISEEEIGTKVPVMMVFQ